MTDDYTKMALFNPYLQMAMGIMAGNSGMTKGEAFSNAMGGGLRSAQVGQEAQRRAAEDALQKQLTDMKLKEYERMRGVDTQFKDFVTSMAAKGGSLQDMYQAMSGVDDADLGTKLGQLVTTAKYNDAIMSRMGGKGGGGGGKGEVFTPLNVNKQMFDFYKPMARDHLGAETWDVMPMDAKLQYIADIVNKNRQQGRSGKQYKFQFPEKPQFEPLKPNMLQQGLQWGKNLFDGVFGE